MSHPNDQHEPADSGADPASIHSAPGEAAATSTPTRYRLRVAYEGTEFCGWQRQAVANPHHPHARVDEPSESGGTDDAGPDLAPPTTGESEPAKPELRTVQGVLQRAVREVVREPVVILGSSRTDSGVHARGQVAAFTAGLTGERGRGWPADRGTEPLVRAINSRLPPDVVVVGADIVPAGFDPIGDCTAKGYTYSMLVSPNRPLWERRWVHHVWAPLDVGRMQEAAAVLVGEHDFAGFAAAGHGRKTTVRRVFDCSVRETPSPLQAPGEQRVVISISGSGFLWNMVRIIAGTLHEVGRGKVDVAQVREALATGDRRKAGPTLPACGLCLEWVKYE
ncbi:MAG: tRNA pseudouridine synthase A [Phycisphaeraceae bacterium]|nr:tRNA pseudouridine synthase A [Phycisphaeraceae bacterium]